jgi:hypothetical protein
MPIGCICIMEDESPDMYTYDRDIMTKAWPDPDI